MGEQDYPFAEVLTLRRKVERLETAQNKYRKEADAITERLSKIRAEGMEAAVLIARKKGDRLKEIGSLNAADGAYWAANDILEATTTQGTKP